MRSVRSPAQTGTCHRQAISQITPQRVADNATLCIGRKGIAQPFEAVSFEQDAIETAVTIWLADQVVTGSKDDAPLFSRRDTARRAAKVGTAALAHLDKDEHLAVAADQVDFAASYPEIARLDAQSLAHQIARSRVFGFAATGGGGIVGFCPHPENNGLHDRRISRIVCRPDPAREPGRPDPARRRGSA